MNYSEKLAIHTYIHTYMRKIHTCMHTCRLFFSGSEQLARSVWNAQYGLSISNVSLFKFRVPLKGIGVMLQVCVCVCVCVCVYIYIYTQNTLRAVCGTRIMDSVSAMYHCSNFECHSKGLV